MNNNSKILAVVFSKLHFRDKENTGKKKFLGILVSYLFANSALSVNNFFSFNKESYTILSFSTGVFLLVFVILSDFANLFFTKKYNDVLNTLPIKDSELVSSKFISAFLFIAIYTLIIAVPQAVFFGLYESSVPEIILFFTANLFSLFFICGVILVIYTMSYKIFSKKSNTVLYILQFIFFFYIIAVSSMASGYESAKHDILSFGFVKFLPQFYFADSIKNPSLLALLILLTVFLYVFFFYYLKRNYGKISLLLTGSDSVSKSKKGGGGLFKKYNKIICAYIIGNSEEKASYLLTLNQFSNSKSLKLKFIPLTFLPLIVCLITLFTGALTFSIFKDSADSIKVLTPSISFTFIMCIRLLISVTKTEDESSPGIGWIYSSLPILSLKKMQNANIKFVFVNFAFPVLIILFFMLSIKMEIYHLLLNMIFLFTAAYFVNTFFLFFDRVYPFSLESTRYNSISKLGEIFFVMLIGIAIFVAQIFIFENVIFVIISIVVFLVISFLLKQKSFALRKQ